MLNLNDDRTDPMSRSPGQTDKLDFVSLSTETTSALGHSLNSQSVPIPASGSSSPAGFLEQWQRSLLGNDEDGRPLLRSKFEVPWATVKAELLFALTGADTLVPGGLTSRWASSFAGGSGVLSDISANFEGDWWGPLWIPMTHAVFMLISVHADKILVSKSAQLSLGRMLFAFILPYAFTAAVYGLLRVFTQIVVRDATFFGTPQQRRKWISIAGYSLTPFVAITAIDALFGLFMVPRRGLLHLLFLSLAAIPSSIYLEKRFPVRAIGGFAPHWDRRSAKMLFWFTYGGIFSALVLLIHIYFS